MDLKNQMMHNEEYAGANYGLASLVFKSQGQHPPSHSEPGCRKKSGEKSISRNFLFKKQHCAAALLLEYQNERHHHVILEVI